MSTQSILNLLRGKTTRRIRFTFPASGTDLTIDSRAFTRVATAIDGGEVGIRILDPRVSPRSIFQGKAAPKIRT